MSGGPGAPLRADAELAERKRDADHARLKDNALDALRAWLRADTAATVAWDACLRPGLPNRTELLETAHSRKDERADAQLLAMAAGSALLAFEDAGAADTEPPQPIATSEEP